MWPSSPRRRCAKTLRGRSLRLVIPALLFLGACAQDESPKTTGTEEPSPEATETFSEPQVLEPGGPTGRALLAGTYVTARFEPAVTFRLDEAPGSRWSLEGDLPDTLGLGKEDTAFLTLLRPSKVIDPKTLEEVALPSDLLTWIRTHPNLDVANPTSASIGGIEGAQVDITAVTPVSKQRCGIGGDDPPCVAIAPISEGAPFIFVEGTVARITVIDVDGQAIMAVIEDQADTYEQFLPQAERVLETIEFVA
jgi:hypothetical protein